MNEWEFSADVASWINEILAEVPSLPFSRAKCEQRGKGSQKRRDLTLLNRDQRVVLTGEVKLPYARDGGTPYNAAVVTDARRKAQRAGSPFFFTWNVNQFVLWQTAPSGTPWTEQNYKTWGVTSVHSEAHIELPMTTHAIKGFLKSFLDEFAQILRGTSPIGFKSPDEKFIEILESSLQMPIMLNLVELAERYKKARFKMELDKWMREEHGWVISDDPEDIRDTLERAAKFACYALVNKLVFHEALLKRYRPKMDTLAVPDHIDTGDDLRGQVEGYFAKAKEITKDYETVFGEDHSSIGNRIPFYSDSAVPHWRVLMNQIHKFDFSKLDYEVIGNIFERLISPQERHKFGQFYTRVEVVDLINAFCICRGDEKVMDPACGGGTFLVRAYARKRELLPARKHREILWDLFGVDVSHFAAHLTTINLATRDLIDYENYPQIGRSDFFDIKAHKIFISLPTHISAKGLGKVQHRRVEIPPLDAVVGNPPYVRQEHIPSGKRKPGGGFERATKEYYQDLVRGEVGADLSGRSDIHCYFWPHATSFLKDDGYLCFLTSSQWLDVEYGFHLQDWILENFEIAAIFESIDEPWFVGARVTTAVTILRRQKDENKRMNNTVRFVQLRRPISEILAHDGTTAGAVSAADHFRDEILSLKNSVVNERYRARLVRQGDLGDQGVELGRIMGKPGEYYGGKWGIHLRAPDFWFDLLQETGQHWDRLGRIAEVKRGITSGCDDFFYVRDVTAKHLTRYENPVEFQENAGYPREVFESGDVKLVQCGEGHGELRPIEAKYLEPEVHSLMEIDSYSVTARDCSRHVVLVPTGRKELRGTYALRYIEWGESNNRHKGSTCAARATHDREWYDLTGHRRGALFWPMGQQYKHCVPTNDYSLICNHNLFDLWPKQGDPNVLGGVLNSTLVVLSKFQYGRPVGVEGNLKTEVIDVKVMLVPDATGASEVSTARVADTFRRMKGREARQLLSERRLREMAYRQAGKEAELANLSDQCELDTPDRRELDDAVLEMIGVRSRKRRQQLIDELYDYLREFFERTRQKEEKAIANKKKTQRRGAARPSEIAGQIYEEIAENHPQLLRKYGPDFLDSSKPFDTFDLPPEGTPEPVADMVTPHGVLFRKGRRKSDFLIEAKNDMQAQLICLLAASGVRGLVRVPHEAQHCRQVVRSYETFINERDTAIRELIQERTAHEDMQDRIHGALIPLIAHGPNEPPKMRNNN